MKKIIFFFLFTTVLFFSSCSDIEYTHPLDTKGTYDHPEDFQDDDQDGIANLWDPDHPRFESNKDTSKPIITFSDNEDTVRIEIGDLERIEYYKNRFVVTDNDPTVTKSSTIVESEFNITISGTYPMIYTATDTEGNQTTKTRTVILYEPDKKDTEKPVIIFQDSLIFIQGDTFDPLFNVIASDNIDNDITSKIKVTNLVNTSVPGKYTVTYSVSDAAGNTTTLERTIFIEKGQSSNDIDWPVITLKGSTDTTISYGSIFVDPGYSAYDSSDGDLTSKVSVTGEVGTNPGVYTITYQVTDKGSHSISVTRRVKVQGGSGIDDEDPVIVLINKNDSVTTIAVGGNWKKPDLLVQDNFDNISADSVKVSNPPNTNIADTYTVTLYVTDKANNTGTLKIKVIVEDKPLDTTPPKLTLNRDNPDTIGTGSSYIEKGAKAVDSVDGEISVKITTTGEVNTAVPGTYTITYKVSDLAGNEASEDLVIVVMDGVSEELISKYEVPINEPLASINKAFTVVITEGKGVPDFSKFKEFKISWTSGQWGGLHDFSFSFENPINHLPILSYAEHTFKESKPTLTISGLNSTIANIDGEYYVKIEDDNFIWVRTDGSYAIIFKP